jgi:hypothetical protein
VTALLQLINTLLAILKRVMAKQEQQQHEKTVDEIQSNPGAFLADHFGRVPDKSIDHNADKTDPRRTSTD